MQESSGIPSSTMASFKYRLKNKRTQLDKKSTVVVDEAGMMDLHDMALLVTTCKHAGAKLILVGDPDQLSPIGPGAPLRALTEEHGFTEISYVYRQNDKKDKQATRDLAKGNMQRALKHYEEKDALCFEDNSEKAMAKLVNECKFSNDTIILTHKNDSVDRLNQLARAILITEGKLSKESQQVIVSQRLSTPDGLSTQLTSKHIELSIGDRILFKKKDRQHGIVNSEFATIQKLVNNQISCRLDNGKQLDFKLSNFNEFDHGYATTVHKSQGMTKENLFVFADSKYWDRHLAYVAFSRHKNTVKLYAAKTHFKTTHELTKALSRSAADDSTLGLPQ